MPTRSAATRPAPSRLRTTPTAKSSINPATEPATKPATKARATSTAKPAAAPRAYQRFTGRGDGSYVTSSEVVEIVNLAMHLGRPLLVEGEAGCGKTRLAQAIAAELGYGPPVMSTVKSTSQAKDLLYRFDSLRRLQDAQDPANRRAREVWPYVELHPLGRALATGEPGVVLIDEIDKADIDFPNDLLEVLDRFEFEIDEMPERESKRCERAKGFGRHVKAPIGGLRPVVIVTSNREKQLPEPFLRRCLYLDLKFPDDTAMLRRIVAANLGQELDAVSERLVERAVDAFIEVRRATHTLTLLKRPATSELVDWVRALHWAGRTAESVSTGALGATDRAVLFKVQKDLEIWLLKGPGAAPPE